MGLRVQRDACVGAGQCALVAPAVFDQDDDGIVMLLQDDPDGAALDAATKAARLCPGARDHRHCTMTRVPRVVIVGASIGGVTAAETLRQEGFGGEIVLIGDEPHHPYTRPPLSKKILLGQWEREQATIRTVAQLAELEIELHACCAALGLDVAARVICTSDGDVPYDELIVATGSKPRQHPRLPMALTLRTIEDALVLRDHLSASRRVGVVGAGVLGSEIARAARTYGADTVLLARSGTLAFGSVGTLLSSRLRRLHEDHGRPVPAVPHPL